MAYWEVIMWEVNMFTCACPHRGDGKPSPLLPPPPFRWKSLTT